MTDTEMNKAKAVKPSKAVPYKGHRAGSRKGTVHKTFDTHGEKKAFAVARMKGIKESTARQWIAVWKREAREAAGGSDESKVTKLAEELAKGTGSDTDGFGQIDWDDADANE